MKFTTSAQLERDLRQLAREGRLGRNVAEVVEFFVKTGIDARREALDRPSGLALKRRAREDR